MGNIKNTLLNGISSTSGGFIAVLAYQLSQDSLTWQEVAVIGLLVLLMASADFFKYKSRKK